MTNLNEVTFGLNRYCGPSVLSILTGKDTDTCAKAISAVSGQRVVRGAQVSHILRALDKLGFDQIRKPLIARTLFGCLNALVNFDGFYLIVVPDHIVAIEIKEKSIYFCDNHTGKPIKAEASARLTQEVMDIYYVKERPKPAGPTAQELRENRIKELQDLARDLTTKILKLESERSQIWVEVDKLRMGSPVK